MAKNKALASAQKAYQKGLKARQTQQKAQKPKKKKEKTQREETIPKEVKPKASTSAKPKTPSTNLSSQYESYKKSSFAPKVTQTTTKPKVTDTSLPKAQTAYKKGQEARENLKNCGVGEDLQ